VIAVRGTLEMHDVLVDLVCASAPLTSVHDVKEDGSEIIVEGFAHSGFLKSAQYLASVLHAEVVEALRANPGYGLVITGHSLGAGVATLLTLLWARMPVFRARNIRAVVFAAPCSVCAQISQAPFTMRHITSVVTGDDIVSRLSLASFKDLQLEMMALANLSSSASTEERARALATVEREADTLHCAGRVWWINSAEFAPEPMVEVDPVRELSAIELFNDLFTIHLPSAYLDTLADMVAGRDASPVAGANDDKLTCKDNSMPVAGPAEEAETGASAAGPSTADPSAPDGGGACVSSAECVPRVACASISSASATGQSEIGAVCGAGTAAGASDLGAGAARTNTNRADTADTGPVDTSADDAHAPKVYVADTEPHP